MAFYLLAEDVLEGDGSGDSGHSVVKETNINQQRWDHQSEGAKWFWSWPFDWTTLCADIYGFKIHIPIHIHSSTQPPLHPGSALRKNRPGSVALFLTLLPRCRAAHGRV
mmetsp:Transcript_9207/g.14105  ORF Transcript_9207/g.14105 Transcript_9207/m.14105 type:complete len:109 (+) Transcript_9207:746-1072(+)